MTIDEATERKRAVVERRVGCGDFEGTGDRHTHGGVALVEVGPSAKAERIGGTGVGRIDATWPLLQICGIKNVWITLEVRGH